MEKTLEERLEEILNEIASYEVPLAEDPTLPSLGNRYLQKVLSQCRSYLNRVTFYIQETKREEKRLLTELKIAKMDLEFKTKEKLAEDMTVRQQHSIKDREATAAVMLADEHRFVLDLEVKLLNLQEVIKLVKFRHSELQRTNSDIKLQRNMVRDDRISQMGGEEGYSRPQSNQDRSIESGMTPPVRANIIDPTDLLDPNKRPEDLPEPVDSMHAQQIAEFYSNSAQPTSFKPSAPTQPEKNYRVEDDSSEVKSIQYTDLLG